MPTIRSILHPTDLSDGTEGATKFAFEMARDYGARLILLHVIEPFSNFGYMGGTLPDPATMRVNADTALRALLPLHEGVDVARVVAVGQPDEEILSTASEWYVDLIVLGTHGRTGLSRLFMGSVAEEVMRRATCPVVALPPAASKRVTAETTTFQPRHTTWKRQPRRYVQN
jgi:nucleotide-binding universal stress UspA family protein